MGFLPASPQPLIAPEKYITPAAGTGSAVKIRHGSATVTGNHPEVRHCAAHQAEVYRLNTPELIDVPRLSLIP